MLVFDALFGRACAWPCFIFLGVFFHFSELLELVL